MAQQYLVSDLKPDMVLMEVSEDGKDIPKIMFWITDVTPDASHIIVTYHFKHVLMIRSGYSQDDGWGDPLVINFEASAEFSPNAREATQEERVEFDAPLLAEYLPSMVWRQFGKQACLVTVPYGEALQQGDVPFKF
jgi:hypothetical protein